MIDKIQALEIIDRRDFFNDRAGRELWADKPKEIQDEDIRNAHEDYELLKEYILNQPKVGETARLIHNIILILLAVYMGVNYSGWWCLLMLWYERKEK